MLWRSEAFAFTLGNIPLGIYSKFPKVTATGRAYPSPLVLIASNQSPSNYRTVNQSSFFQTGSD